VRVCRHSLIGLALRDRATVRPNRYGPCPFETYPVTPLPFTMTSVAFPKSIFSELAANLPRHACRTGESITMSSNARAGIGFRSRIRGMALFLVVIVASAGAMAATTHYIAANGSDSSSGTTNTSPWQHAPGMPACTGSCASYTPQAGDQFIFRGGDTWHMGNSSLSPYTGGTWNWQWSGNSSTCVYEGTQTGCIYIGVDQNWYSGSSWSRPILNGDNPLSKSVVSSCPYQTGPNNQLFNISSSANAWVIFDNFELLGWCTNNTASSNLYDAALVDGGNGHQNPNTFSNVYVHGWTVGTGASDNSIECTVFGMGNNSSENLIGVVIDGSDTDPATCAWGTFPTFTHMKDSIIRYTTQGVGQGCHDIHDNIFEHFYNPYVPTHGNVLECNADAAGSTPNVFYNNIVRHDDTSMEGAGQVHLWFCPNGTASEYWFNNLVYDVVNSNYWDVAGPPSYGSCTNAAGQFMFNNTLLSGTQPCNLSPNNTGGKYLTVYNEHLINTPYDGTGCTGAAGSTTNVSMAYSAADAQGYTGTPGTVTGDTCKNDVTPCSPTAATNSTVGVGSTLKNYCSTLQSYASIDPSMGDAAAACLDDTTTACSYNSTNHTMVCPEQPPIVRPTWDAGAYQWGTGNPPNPPTDLTAVVQ